MMDVPRGHVRDRQAVGEDDGERRPCRLRRRQEDQGSERHIAVDVEEAPIMIKVHAADVQDRGGAPAVIVGMLEKALEVTKLRADGYQGPKLVSKLEELGLGGLLESSILFVSYPSHWDEFCSVSPLFDKVRVFDPAPNIHVRVIK